MQIIGDVDIERLFCAGSLTKFVTTYVSLSLLAEKYSLKDILDDDHFLDQLSVNAESQTILRLFQSHIKNKFSIRDLCTYYSGLPYTFDVSQEEVDAYEKKHQFHHHSILQESDFLRACQNQITPIYTNRCKFHYSELSILFFGYFLEKVYGCRMEDLYDRYIINRYQLQSSLFSRTLAPHVGVLDLSDHYDYPAIAISNHGYFCYSNGYYTTLRDMQILLNGLLKDPIFHVMTDLRKARAASNTLMNGLAVEIRKHGDDILYGYEGLSFSGCNIWAYSTKHQQGFLTFINDEEKAYDVIYGEWGYTTFDRVFDQTQTIYRDFLKRYTPSDQFQAVSRAYQGQYQRVRINQYHLETIFTVGDHYVIIRNPEEIQYELTYVNGHHAILGKDGVHGATIGFVQSKSDHYYMYHEGTLYKKISN